MAARTRFCSKCWSRSRCPRCAGSAGWGTNEHRMPTGAQANTLEELAKRLGLDPQALTRTVSEFNSSVQPGTFNHEILDGKCTKGLAVNKSNRNNDPNAQFSGKTRSDSL